MEFIQLATRRMVATITGLVVPGNQQYLGAKVSASISSLYCQSLCRRSNQKKCYKHVASEVGLYISDKGHTDIAMYKIIMALRYARG